MGNPNDKFGHYDKTAKQPAAREAMIRFNGTGVGIKLSTVLILAGMSAALIGNYYLSNYQMTEINRKLVITPAEVNNTVIDFKKDLTKSVNELSAKVETTRVERLQDVKSLRSRLTMVERENTRNATQVQNLEKLMEDIRDSLRRQESNRR